MGWWVRGLFKRRWVGVCEGYLKGGGLVGARVI